MSEAYIVRRGGSTQNVIKRETLLNVESPYTKIIPLNEILTSDDTVCTTVLEAIDDYDEFSLYAPAYDNADADDFEPNPYIEFRGGMRLKDAVYSEAIEGEAVGEYVLFQSDEIESLDKINPNTTSSRSNNTTLNLTVNFNYTPQVVRANGDIRLDNVHNIKQITFITTGHVTMVISFDGGVTWKAFDGVDTWENIDGTDVDDVIARGMDKDIVTGISQAEWDTIRDGSNTIRFAYGIADDGVNATLGMQVIIMAVNKVKSDVEYSLHPYGNKLIYTIRFDGGGYRTFVINYVERGVIRE